MKSKERKSEEAVELKGQYSPEMVELGTLVYFKKSILMKLYMKNILRKGN